MRRRYIYALALLTMLSGCNRAGDDYDEIANQGGFLIEFASNSDNEDNEDNDYEEDSTSEDSENNDMSDELNDEDNEEKESDSEDSDEDELEDSDEDSEDTGNIDYASVYDIYHNENFGYALIYPDTFTQSDESGSGDGVTMSDDNGSTLRMWGAYNAAGSTGSEALDQYIASSSNVAYSSAQDNYWCYTCRTDEGKIEYRAGYIDSDYEAGFELIYDEGLQENYGEAVNAMMEHLLNGNVF